MANVINDHGDKPILEALEPRLLLSTTSVVDSLDDVVAADGFVPLREAIEAAGSGIEDTETSPLSPVVGGWVAFNDHIADYGGGTHANTTDYSAMAGETASGLLKDIVTGVDMPVTLTVTASGVHYAGSQGAPAPGTDAHTLFDGFVDLGAGTGAGIVTTGSDHYTYTFSGLDTGDRVTYNFHGTAIRGDSGYTNRWTLVTLVGADGFVAAHSIGAGAITSAFNPSLAANQMALWTGDNSQNAQGFVAGWTGIDPGADGVFDVFSEQYTGAIPTTVDPGGIADGNKGYSLSGIRLEEVVGSNLIVTSLDDTELPDDGVLTLREAIAEANANIGADTILFDPSLFSENPGEITLGGEELAITDDLTLVGPGADQLTIDANGQSRVFHVSGGGTQADLSGLTISGGYTETGNGGGIYNSGTLMLTNTTISNNLVFAGGNGGGIYNSGTLTLTNTTVSSNSVFAGDNGGGIYNSGTLTMTNTTVSSNWLSFPGYGGGIYNSESGTLTMTDTVVSGNSVSGHFSGGGIYNAGILTLANTIVSGNSVSGGGRGGGIYNSGTLTMTNTTVSGNSADGADSGGGGIYSSGTLTLTNTTVSNNSVSNTSSGAGAGLVCGGAANLLRNTIVAGNFDETGGVADDVRGTLDPSSSHNFIGAADGDPKLTAVTDADEMVVYYIPQDDSPLVDAGNNSLALDPEGFPLLTDQRGIARIVNDTVDIGAIEYSPTGGIQGMVWNDRDGNGVPDTDEPGLESVLVYADLNEDGTWDGGEPSGLTESDGSYSITDVPVGMRVVRQVIPSDYKQTFPLSLWDSVEVVEGQVETGVNFGNVSTLPPEVEMGLYRVSDTSGAAHTNSPGTERDVFHVGETVRITLQAKNTGTVAADANWVLNVAPVGDHDDVRHNSDPAPNNTNNKTIPNDGAWHYYSFDWTIKTSDPIGSYDLLGSIRNAANWSAVLDTTGPDIAEEDWSEEAWLTGPDITDDVAIDVTFLFQGNDGKTYPANYTKVEVYDYNPAWPDELVAEGYTDTNGHFFIGGISKEDTMPLGGARDIYVKVIASNESVSIRPNLLSPPYNGSTVETPITQDGGGLIDFGNLIVGGAEAFGLLAPAQIAREWLRSNTSPEVLLDQIWVLYPDPACNYDDLNNRIYQWDLHNPHSYNGMNDFFHEYGHYLHDSADELNPWLPGASDPSHSFHSESVDAGAAFTEGWADFFQLAVSHTPSETPPLPGDEAPSWYFNDIEKGAFWNWAGRTPNLVEGSTASVLWDLYDSRADDDDGADQYTFNDIFLVLDEDEPSQMWSDAPDDDFYHYWVNQYGETRELQEIFIDHGFAVTDDLRENNDDSGEAIELDQMGIYSDLILSDAADWFKFTTGGTMGDGSYISVVFDHPRGNLDINVYFWNEQQGALDLIGSFATFTDNELVDLSTGNHLAGQYYIEIIGWDGDYHPDYDLVLNIVENEAPTARDDSPTVDEDSVDNVIDVLSNDDDPDVGNSLTVTAVGLASHGTASLVGGQVRYTPSGDYYDSDSFSYTIEDNHGATDTADVNVTVTAVNDAPSFAKGSDQGVNEDAGSQTVATWATAISAGPTNESGQTVIFLVSNDNNGLFSQQPDVSADGTLTFTPAPDAYGTAEVAVQALDNGGTANGGDNTSDAQTFIITVMAINDAPSFVVGTDVVVDEDSGLQTMAGWATGISAGPANESGQTVTFLVSNDNNGLFSQQPDVSADGTLTFTPTSDAYGTAEVTVQARDNGGTANGGDNTSDAQSFRITVTGLYDADEYETLVSQFGLRGDGLAADSNGDGRVDIVDFAILRGNFGSPLPAAGPATEPDVTVAPVATPKSEAEPIAAATGPVVPVVSQPFGNNNANDDLITTAASVPAIDLLVESPSAGGCIPEPQAISGGSAATTLQRAATSEYDLRPLGDDPVAGEGDDLLADILAESALALPSLALL